MAESKPTILIIRSWADGMKLQQVFLRNREWPFQSTAVLSDAIQLIKKFKPAYVLVPVDHPNKAVASFPELISKSFGCTVIAYAEKANASSLARLINWKMKYNLHPPVSGPNILRMIARIEKDKIRTARESALENAADASQKTQENDLENLVANFVMAAPAQAASVAPKAAEKPVPAFVKSSLEEARSFETSLKSSLNNVAQKAREKAARQAYNVKDAVASRVACMIVNGQKFSGYLVVALGENRTVDAKFFANIRKNLYQFLESRGEVLSHQANDLLSLTIKPVEFLPWAKDQAEFLLSTVHESDEIAMAFFPVSPLEFEVLESAKPEMVQVHIEDIEVDKPLEFDVFLYLQANQKYVLYNKRGGILGKEQKERLSSRGVHFVHIRKDSELFYLQQKAKRFFNESIENFQQRRPANVAVAG